MSTNNEQPTVSEGDLRTEADYVANRRYNHTGYHSQRFIPNAVKAFVDGAVWARARLPHLSAQPDEAAIRAARDAINGVLAEYGTKEPGYVAASAAAVEALTAALPHLSAPPDEAAIRADEREKVAQRIVASVRYGFGMSPDGSEDAQAMAYAEGIRDAADIASSAGDAGGEA